jgi:hypothetical protein
MELAFGVITAVFQLYTTAANIMNYRPVSLTSYMNRFSKSQKLAGRWQRSLGRLSNKFPKSSRLKKISSRRKPGDGLLREKSIETAQSKS